MSIRIPIALVVLVCIFANFYPAAVSAQRTVPTNASPAARFDPDTVQKFGPKDKSNDFAEKGLPAPAEFGGPPTDAMAAQMAKEISNYEKDSLPLLITMLQRAGFYIINNQQKVLYQPTTGSGTGLAFYDFEVVGMYKLSRRGIVSSVEKMANIIGKDSREMPPPMIADLMLKDLRADVNAENPLVRFWARLIVEFGRNALTPVDLMTATPAQAQLNIIQASLWERRLIGDVAAFAEKALAKARFGTPNKNAFSIVPASYGFYDAPCQTNEVTSLVLDGSATLVTTGHGAFLDQLEKILTSAGKETLGKVAKGLGAANIALSWAKLVAALMTLKGEIKVADPMPLVRTKNSDEGESRLMTARVWADVGNLGYINCVRVAMNTATGLDFNMPSDGPLSDRDISWEMTGDSSFSGQGSSRTGAFDNFANLKPPDGANRDPTQQITNDNGESQMNIVGAPKIPTVVNKPVVPVRKKAVVKIRVALKSPRDKTQNFLDIGGAALGVALTGPIAILSALPELGFRYKWDAGAIGVPVKDWQLCTDDWAGSVYMSRYLKKTEAISILGRTGTRTIIESGVTEYTLDPRKRVVAGEKIPPPKPAYVSMKIDNTDIFEGIGEADVCCNSKAGKDPKARIRDAREFHSFNQGKDFIDISLSNRFLLTIIPRMSSTDLFKGIQHNSFTVAESACAVDEDKPSEETFETMGMPGLAWLMDSKTGRNLRHTAEKGESVEEIWGEESFKDKLGADIVFRWALARCGDD